MYKKLLSFAVSLSILSFGAFTFDADAKKKKEVEVDIYELSIDENIAIPRIGKNATQIVALQQKEIESLQSLQKQGFPYEVEAIRDGEVIMVTIPMRNLFDANSSVLNNSAETYLKPFLKYCSVDYHYKVVLVAHADNTGNDIYAQNITNLRVNSVFDWIAKNASTKLVVPYGLGNSDPIVDNNSIVNRVKNRRLVIYIIPEKALISKTKRNKILR